MTEESIVTFTEPAIVAIKEALSEEAKSKPELTDVVLRLSVMGGGCSGYQYQMGLESLSDVREDDLILPVGDFSVLLDSVSSGYLKGTVVDYISGLNGTGFKFINPNAKRTCGCGSSFS